jgi:GT2 family glycosyltransferase
MENGAGSVGVVVVTHNSEATIGACLSAVVAEAADIVVVDTASTDHTVDLVRQHGVRVITGENHGFGSACNRGAGLLETEFLFFLNPDAVVHRGTPSRLLEVAIEARANRMETALSPLFDDDLDGECFRLWHYSAERAIAKLMRRSPIDPVSLFGTSLFRPQRLSGAALFLEREVFSRSGGFDERFFLYWEDADLSVRLARAGVELLVVPDAMAGHVRAASTGRLPDIDEIRGRSSLMFVRKHRSRAQLWIAGLDLALVTLVGCLVLCVRGDLRAARRRARRWRALAYLFSSDQNATGRETKR